MFRGLAAFKAVRALSLLLLLAAASEGHAFRTNVGFWKIGSPNLAFTTAAQTVFAGNCSSAVTIVTRNGLNVATNPTSLVTLDLTGPAGVTFYTDHYCTQALTTLTIPTNRNWATVYFVATTVGSATFNVTAPGYLETSQSQTVNVNPFIWTGGGANALWATGANWSGGAPPDDNNEVALFDGTCVSNCSPSIASNLTVRGVRILAGHSGSITQNSGVTLSVGPVGWVQFAGTYNGGDAAVSVSGPLAVVGGIYNATSANLTIGGNQPSWNNTLLDVYPAATFNAGTGTLTVSIQGNCWQHSFLDLRGGLTVNNFVFNGVGDAGGCGGFAYLNLRGDTLTINGNFNYTAGHLATGTWAVRGNVTTGSSTNANNYSNPGIGTIRLIGNAAGQTLSSSFGPLPNVEIDAGANNVTMSGFFVFYNDYRVTSVGTLTATGAYMYFYGNQFPQNNQIRPGSAVYAYVFFGATNGCSWDLGGETLTSSSGGVNLNSGFSNSGTINNGTVSTSGLVSINSSTSYRGSAIIRLTGSASVQGLNGGNLAPYPNIEIDAGTNNVNLNGTITVAGSFRVLSVGTLTTTSSTLNFNNTTTSGGAVFLPGSATYNAITVNSNNGWNTDLAGALTASSVTLTTGNMRMLGYDLTTNALALNSRTLTKGGGILTVGGSAVGTGSLFGGTVNP